MSNAIIVSAGLAVAAATVAYLVAYSSLYDWHKSPLGRVMSASLLGAALFALGVVLATSAPFVGAIVAAVGAVAYVAALAARWSILRATAARQRAARLNAGGRAEG